MKFIVKSKDLQPRIVSRIALLESDNESRFCPDPDIEADIRELQCQLKCCYVAQEIQLSSREVQALYPECFK